MVSIKLKFRASTKECKEGALFFQIIHNRAVRRIKAGYHIYPQEWDNKTNNILISNTSDLRHAYLNSIQNDIKWKQKRLENLVKEIKIKKYTIDDIIRAFQGETEDGKGVFDYMHRQIQRLKNLGRDRCSETIDCTLKSFMRFRGGIDISFPNLSKDVMEQYEAYMKHKKLTRNTSSFYMRNLRTIYKKAVDEGLTKDNQPFRKVYTGIDKTVKRAISIDSIRKIKELDLRLRPALDYARDMLLFSFYMRGMSFVDIAYLKKKDSLNGYISYRRKKTGQQLTVKLTKEAQSIISKYKNETQYLLPIITNENDNERKQYQNQLIRINRHLKTIGNMVGLSVPLSTYVMRHAWATIARDKGIDLAIISQGLGHENEATTRIYLDSIRAEKIDEANQLILDEL